MNEALQTVIQKRMERTAQALRGNNMDAYCVATAAEVPALAASLMHEGETVAVGGSATLDECGVMELLRAGRYNFLDRYAPGLAPQEVEDIYRRAFFADTFLASANAVTEAGEIFNVDGNSNRIAAIAFGPKSVILVVGYNKLVRDLDEAETRLEAIAAPANAIRLHKKTPCVQTGVCAHCKSPDRICCTYMVMRQQRVPGRVKVILVGESLGF